ncbi:hypothetical protein IAD21_05394 [Abditibacteriota bacterium]|nr:hypothetical protein IAD21_05394 [Abditibacteriota bacterium]
MQPVKNARHFLCQQSEVIFTKKTASSSLAKLSRIKFKFVNFHHNIVGPEWSTGGFALADPRHHIHFFRSGSAQITHEGVTTEMKPGYAYWTPCNLPVSRHCEATFEEFILTCNCEMIDGIDLFQDWPERRHLCVGPWDMDSLPLAWSEAPLSLNTLMQLQGQLYQWVGQYFGGLDAIIAHHALMFSRYANVFNWSESRLGANLRVAELAGIHGTSLQAFTTAFTRDLGISPKAYLNQRLNQEACQLIVNTNWTIKAIAKHLGFDDQYYFSRFFTKMNDLSPINYRRMFHL